MKQEIIYRPLTFGNFFAVVTQKKQIVVHDTISGDIAKNIIAGWGKDPLKVGAHFIILRTGEVYCTVPIQFWLHHLGVKETELLSQTNTALNMAAIAIELANYGPIKKLDNGKWENHYGKEILVNDVIEFNPPHKGFSYYEAHPDAQLQSLEWLLGILMSVTGIVIDKKYDPEKAFEVNPDALNGKGGIYTHAAYRKGKYDCVKEEKLLQIFKNIKNKFDAGI